jgi:hypothetical protein
VTNPSYSTSTGSFHYLMTLASTGAAIDTADALNLPAGFTIIPASFKGSTPTVALTSYVAGASGVSATLAFTTNNAIPTTGRIVVTFPSNFTIANGAVTVSSSTISDGSLSAIAASRVITISRSGAR